MKLYQNQVRIKYLLTTYNSNYRPMQCKTFRQHVYLQLFTTINLLKCLPGSAILNKINTFYTRPAGLTFTVLHMTRVASVN